MALVEIKSAPNGRAKCVECRRKIPKNTPRGIIHTRDEYNRRIQRFICHKCMLEKMNKSIEVLKKKKRELIKLTKKHMKDVILMELEKNGYA